MSEIGLASLELLGDFDRLINTEMGDVWIGPERIQHQRVHALQQLHTFFWNLTDIGTVRNVADSESQHIKIRAVLQWNWNDSSSQNIQWFRFVDWMNINLRRCSNMCLLIIRKRVGKRSFQPLFNIRIAIYWHGMAKVKLEQSQIIEAHHMVGVFVSVDDCMANPDFLTQQLCSQIWRCIDQQIALWQTENGATPATLVSRMIALTDTA